MDLITRAISIKPSYAEAHKSLGIILQAQGKHEEAFASFQRVLEHNPDSVDAHYKLATVLYESKNFEAAHEYYEKSQYMDWRERSLSCLYRCERYEEFRDKLTELIKIQNASPLMASLSAHYAINFDVEDEYKFCPNPLDFIYRNNIDCLADENSQLKKDLIRDINNADVDEQPQTHLTYGVQSAGKLFNRSEASFRELSLLIKQEIENYRKRFSSSACVLIDELPADINFSASWYIKMEKGGHLSSHIHESGWLSGAVYLALPSDEKNSGEGSTEYSIDGDDYPRRHENFPTRIVNLSIGDITLFPSSLFHRTLPFNSEEERICIAFDVQRKK